MPIKRCFIRGAAVILVCGTALLSGCISSQDEPLQLEAISETVQLEVVETEELKLFTTLQRWNQIDVVSGEHRVSITDPQLLETAASLFLILPKDDDHPNGFPNDIEPFSLIFMNDEGSYEMLVHSRRYASLPAILNDYFTISPDLSHWGKGFIPLPSYMPEDSTERSILDSSMVVVESENQPVYYFTEARVRGIAKVFLTHIIRHIDEPERSAGEPLKTLTFYTNGKQLRMEVFTDYVSITDSSQTEVWLLVDSSFIDQLRGYLSAG